ncbi:unnamed protein product [Scytosiphon promiscuus]
MVDMVVHRHELPETIARVCSILTKAEVQLPGEAELDPPLAVETGERSVSEAVATPPSGGSAGEEAATRAT